MNSHEDGHGAVDWANLRQRLEAAFAGTDGSSSDGDGDDDAIRGVLEARARRLAQASIASAPSDAIDVVSVRIANESYAVEAAQVREVFRLADFAQLPGAAPPVFGVTVWRGELLLLLDLRRGLGLSATALNDLRHVLVLEEGATPVAILVDQVQGMSTIRAADVRPTAGRNGAAREFVRGVTSDALIVLETTALLRVLD